MGRFTGILGLLTMLGLAYTFSTNRRAINKKTVVWGLGLQVVFAIFVLKIEIGRVLFQKAGNAVNRLPFLDILEDVVPGGRARKLEKDTRGTARDRAGRQEAKS